MHLSVFHAGIIIKPGFEAACVPASCDVLGAVEGFQPSWSISDTEPGLLYTDTGGLPAAEFLPVCNMKSVSTGQIAG